MSLLIYLLYQLLTDVYYSLHLPLWNCLFLLEVLSVFSSLSPLPPFLFLYNFKQPTASIFTTYEQGVFSVSWVESIQKCLETSCSNRILAHWVSVKSQNYKYCSEDRRRGKTSRMKMILKLKIARIDFGTGGWVCVCDFFYS